MENSANATSEARRCVACSKPEVELPASTSLKRCSRCQQATYCSKECQTSHWPQHKASCQRPAARNNTANTRPTPRSPPDPHLVHFFNEFEKETKTYQILIDTFRLRCDDDYAWGGHYHGVYGQVPPLPVFRDFLTRAKSAGMLPRWWNEEKERECERKAMEDDHFNIKWAVEKHDIQEHYDDSMMPMTLRMVAENVYGGGYGMGQRPMPADYVCQCQGGFEDALARNHMSGVERTVQ